MGFVLTLMGLIPGPAGGLPGKRCHLSLGPQRGRQKGRGDPCSAPLRLMAAANPIANDQEQGGALTAPRHVAGSCSSGRPPAPRPFLQGCPPASDRPCTHRAQRSAIPALRPLPLRFLPETVPRFCGAAPLGRAGRAPGRRRPGKAELPAPLLLSALMPWASQHQRVPSPAASTTPPAPQGCFPDSEHRERKRERSGCRKPLLCPARQEKWTESWSRSQRGWLWHVGGTEDLLQSVASGCASPGGVAVQLGRAWPMGPTGLEGSCSCCGEQEGGRESGRAEGRPGARPWPWRKEE